MAPTLEELFARYGQLVLRRARALLGDEHAARDATQEVFLKAHRGLSDFRGEASPVTWLYRATTNHCLNLLRDTQRHSAALVALGSFEESEHHAGLDERLTLSAILRQVPEPLRDIAAYYYLDHMSHEEIAALLGVSRRTVGNRLVEFHAAAQLAVDDVKKVGMR